MASFLLWPRKTRGNGTREASNPSVWPRKVVPKCSQTEEFHRFFLTKRDSTALFGLLGAVFLQRVFKTHGIYPGSRFRGPPGAHFGPPWAHFAPPGASWVSFWPSWGLLGFILALLRLILGLLGPPGAHFGASGALLGPPGVHSGPPRVHSGPPGASWGSFWASWSAPGALLALLARSWGLLGLILALLVRSGALGALLPSTRSTKLSQTPFEITVQKVFSEPLKARCAIP